MITNKDIRVENGSLILNGDPYPLDGQSPEAIMQIVEDNSDTTPTENSTKPVKSGGIYSKIGDLTQTGLTGDSVAEQLGNASMRIATKLEGLVYERTDDASLTAKMNSITAQRKSGAYIMYCSSVNPDFATIGYCTAIGLTVFGAVSVIIAVNSQTGDVWTNGNTSQGAEGWTGWKKIS